MTPDFMRSEVALTSPKRGSHNATALSLSSRSFNFRMRDDIVIIGGGPEAGFEAAWQAANRGAKVTLYEMRPKEMTQAHKTGGLAELVFVRIRPPPRIY